jgi:hypothetical protein
MLAEDTVDSESVGATQSETILSSRGWFCSENISVIARL